MGQPDEAVLGWGDSLGQLLAGDLEHAAFGSLFGAAIILLGEVHKRSGAEGGSAHAGGGFQTVSAIETGRRSDREPERAGVEARGFGVEPQGEGGEWRGLRAEPGAAGAGAKSAKEEDGPGPHCGEPSGGGVWLIGGAGAEGEAECEARAEAQTEAWRRRAAQGWCRLALGEAHVGLTVTTTVL